MGLPPLPPLPPPPASGRESQVARPTYGRLAALLPARTLTNPSYRDSRALVRHLRSEREVAARRGLEKERHLIDGALAAAQEWTRSPSHARDDLWWHAPERVD